MSNKNVIFGVVRAGAHTDVSETLLGAKQYATRHGYQIVSRRNVNSYQVDVVAAKDVNGKWVAQ